MASKSSPVPAAAAQRRTATLARHLVACGVQSGGGHKAQDILPQLTVEELVGLVSGRDFWHNFGVPRFGIPPLRVTDGPNGARGTGIDGPASACVPCGVALGATWDVDLVAEVAAFLGVETKAKGAQILLAPTVNLHRVPLGGRHFECFSEDPILTSRLAVAYIHGLQGTGIGACVKHFACNDQEHERFTVSAEVSEATLRKSYLIPFEAAVKEGKSISVMTGYNKVNGTYCSESPWLLGQVLRKEWGFDGLVMSDWFGTHSTEGCLMAGLDLEMPARPGMFYGKQLLDAVKAGKVPEAELRKRAGTVLSVMERLGLLAEGVSPSELPMQASPNTPAHRELLRRAAGESAVLLKNEGGMLPLPAGSSLAVIGRNATEITMMGGGSPQVFLNPTNISVLEALKKTVHGTVRYELGCDVLTYLPLMSQELFAAPSGQGVLDMSCFSGDAWPSGDSMGTIPIKTLRDNIMTLGIAHRRNPFQPKGKRQPWAARLFTNVVGGEGTYEVSLATTGHARVYLRGQLLLEQDNSKNTVLQTDILGVLSEVRTQFTVAAGESVKLEIEWRPDRHRAALMLGGRRRDWASKEDLLERAVAAASASDAAVVVVGSDEWTEREGQDQPNMDLGDDVTELIHRVAAANPRTLVCLNVGSPKNIAPWVGEVGALLAVWFGGQEAAEGLASVLIDGASEWGPCGRLPTTWGKSLADYPAGVPRGAGYPGESGRVFYGEGEFVGYKWFESRGAEPVFPFGHGLAYTSFAYRDLNLSPGAQVPAGQDVSISISVKNVGARRGKEVVQVYTARRRRAGGLAMRSLQAFAKVALQAGESATVQLRLPAASLAVPAGGLGEFEVFVGPSSAEVRLRQTLRIA